MSLPNRRLPRYGSCVPVVSLKRGGADSTAAEEGFTMAARATTFIHVTRPIRDLDGMEHADLSVLAGPDQATNP